MNGNLSIDKINKINQKMKMKKEPNILGSFMLKAGLEPARF